MNIATILEEQARQSPDRLAIVERDRRVTYKELNARSAAAATELSIAGVRTGMRALVFSRMSIDLYVVLIALFRLRAAAVFVDPSAGRERLDACVRRVMPDAFLAIPRAHGMRLTSAAIRAIPVKAAIAGRVPFTTTIGVDEQSTPHPIAPCAPDTPAVITFTSGSTGEPKATVRTHGFLIAQHKALVESIALAPGDVDLCTLPIFLLANLASGLTSVIPDADLRRPGHIDPGPVVRQLTATGANRTVASPAFLGPIAEHAATARIRLDSLTRIYTGGAPVFPAVLDAIADVCPRASVVALYGSTEAEPIAEIDRTQITAADRVAMSAGSGLLAGRVARSIHLRILRDRWGEPLGPLSDGEFDRAALPSGRIGEIVVSGEHVLTGYLDGRGDEETKIRVADRVWHRTGDAGYLDAEGRLWLLGRCAAKASDHRGVLYPFAVECAASEVRGVTRAAFIAHRDQRLLAVELRGRSADALADLGRRIKWAQIDEIVVLDRIPVDRRHNAKIDYAELMLVLDKRRKTRDTR